MKLPRWLFVSIVACVVGWVVATFWPALNALMIPAASGFLLSILVTVALGWTARHSEAERRAFWRWWTLALALNVLGNVVWSVYDVVTQQALAIFSWVDAFYLARYAALFWSCWRYPRPWRRRQWVRWSAITAVGGVLVWALLYRPAAGGPLTFLGGALYPLLDVSLVAALLLSRPRWSRVQGPGTMKRALTWLAAGTLAYGAANWLNFGARVVGLTAHALWAESLWLLADVLLVGAVLSVEPGGRGVIRPMAIETEVVER